MVQKMIHLLALGLADFLRNPGPLGVDFLEIPYQSGVKSCRVSSG